MSWKPVLVKIQRPLNDPEAPLLVYSQDRSIYFLSHEKDWWGLFGQGQVKVFRWIKQRDGGWVLGEAVSDPGW